MPFGLISNSQELEIWPIRIVKHDSGEKRLVSSNWFSTIFSRLFFEWLRYNPYEKQSRPDAPKFGFVLLAKMSAQEISSMSSHFIACTSIQ